MKRDQTNVRRRVKDTPTAAAGAKAAKVATAEADMRAKARAKARANTRAGAVTTASTKAGAKDRRLIGAKRRIAWHLYEARHDQSEALAWARHDFESIAGRLADIGRSATAALERAEGLASKYRRLDDEAAPMLAATEALWDEVQTEAWGAGLPDDQDEKEIREAIARLGDRREILNALSALERLKGGHRAGAGAA